MGDSSTYQHPVALQWDLGPERLKEVKNKLLLHFQSKKKSNGGECELRYLDCSQGYILIHFSQESVRDRVLQKQTQELKLSDGEQLKLNIRLPEAGILKDTNPSGQDTSADSKDLHSLQDPAGQPKVHDTLASEVMIENVQDNCTPEVLNLLLENVSNLSEVKDFHVEMIPQMCSAKVTFTSPIDTSTFIKKFSSSSRVKHFKLIANPIEETKTVSEGSRDSATAMSSQVVIENVQGGCTLEILNLLVENVSNLSEDQDFHVEMIPEICSAVVTFTSPTDIMTFIKHFSTSSRVNNLQLRAKSLEETKSIRLENLPPNTLADFLILYFESPRNGGGRVQRADVAPGEDAAVVTFYNREVLETVLKKQHEIGKKPVSVYPYHPSLGVPLYGKRGPCITMPKPIEFPVSPYVMEFILREKQIKQSIEGKMADKYCDITWPEPDCPNPAIKLSISRTKSTHLRTMARIVRAWAEQVSTEFSLAVSKYKVTEHNVNASVWEAIKEQVTSSAYERVLVKPDFAKEKVFLAGFSKDVTNIEQTFRGLVESTRGQIERKTQSVTESVPLAPALYEIMCKNGLEKNILHGSPGLRMDYDVSTRNIKLYGLKEEVLNAKCEILSAKQQLRTKTIHPDSQIKQFLFLADNTEMSCFLFLGHNINTMLQIEGDDVTLTALSAKDLTEAEKRMKCELVCKRVPVEDKRVTQSTEWRSLTSHLCEAFNSERVSVLIEEFPPGAENQLVIAGLSSAAEDTYQQLQDFLEKNTPVQKDIPVKSMAVMKFLKEERKEIVDKLQMNLQVVTKQKSLSLYGPKLYMEEAVTLIQRVLSSLYSDTLSIDKPGAKKFCLNNEDMYITTARTKFNCLIHLQKDGEDGVIDDEVSLSEPHYQVTLPDGVIIAVYKDDLTRHRADVVVNAANEDLDHIGGLALALLRAAGPSLQSDSNDIVRRKGRLSAGDAVITGAGNLPCQQVIHTVGPRWDSKSQFQCERLLRRAITRSLELAAENGHRSIAIPAVSSGIFGFPLDLCAQNIVESIRKFVETPQESRSIKNIHLVDSDDTTIKSFTAALKDEFGTQNVEVSQKPERTRNAQISKKPLGGKEITRPGQRMTTQEGLNINVIHGNIQDISTDVIVNSVGTDLDLDSGGASRALLQRAGKKLQKLLHKESQGANVAEGSVFITGGCDLSCQKVIHVVVPRWDGGSGPAEKTLRQILKTCLTTTETNQLSSVTLPAIGTGALGFPGNLVAAAMFDEILRFSSKSKIQYLQQVNIILHSSDENTIQEFSGVLQKVIAQTPPVTKKPKKANLEKGPAFIGPMTSPTLGIHEMKIGPITYQVKTGDITKENTDIIVNSSNSNFTLKAGVSKAILDAAGKSVEDECAQLGSQPHNGRITTKNGNLLCKQILHICGTNVPNDIKSHVIECLKDCERLQATSIAFPALGTGAGGAAPAAVADAMLDAVVEVSRSRSVKSVQMVKVVIFQQEMLNVYCTSMRKKEGTNLPEEKSWLGKITSSFRSFFASETEESDEPKFFELKENIEPAVFHLCGKSKKDVTGASSWLRDLILKEQHENTITDEWMRDFGAKEHRRLLDLQKTSQVTISFESPGSTIKVSGLTRDVFDISNKIQEMIKEIRDKKTMEREAELCSNLVEWRYQDGTKFLPFDKLPNMELEKAKNENRQSTTVDIAGVKYTVNMEMKSANDPLGKQVVIERVPKHGQSIDLPSHWDPMNNDQLKVVPLTPGTTEYTDVQAEFAKTCKMRIIKIERIQNQPLWLNYEIKKQSMDAKNGNTNNVKRLFHGTAPDTVKTVNHNGYNRSYAGKNAAAIGNGTYFAVNASYSAHDTYSRPDGNGYKYMYLALVLTGVSCPGSHGLVAPPAKNQSDLTDLYNSVTDNVMQPSMYVIFNDIQAYPEYLITFAK